jgi:pyruvate dehydrogenase E2 component (dihydrolipoamide acetyltransferase)
MTLEFRLPQYGMGMTDGTIVLWSKAEGDRLLEGEPLVEVEAAKTTVEVAAPVSGTLKKILVGPGANVPVQTVIALIEVAGVTPGAAPTAAAPARSAEGVQSGQDCASTPIARRMAEHADLDIAVVSGSGPRGKVMKADVEAALQRRAAEGAEGERVQVEPRARRAAKELNVDLAQITGSGRNGRIVEADVRAFDVRRRGETPVGPKVAQAPAPSGAGFVDVPHSRMRRIVAQRLTESKQQVPHFYLVAHCEVDALLALRREINETIGEPRLSLNDFVVRAVALAMAAVPDANVTWQETALHRYEHVDVAVAVATSDGLITPIIRGAQAKSVRSIAIEAKALAGRARDGRLAPEDYTGGAVTVSNLGMYGVEEFSAIINPPQSCIFAVGAASERPVARHGVLAVANVMTCTVSFDHRAVDGAAGAKLLAKFKSLIEHPLSLLV